MSDTSWMDDSKCRNDENLQEWNREIPGRDFFHDRKYEKAAINYCKSGCPVFDECLMYAMAEPNLLTQLPDHQGVMAGTTVRQRRKMKRQSLAKILEFQTRYSELLPVHDDPIEDEEDVPA